VGVNPKRPSRRALRRNQCGRCKRPTHALVGYEGRLVCDDCYMQLERDKRMFQCKECRHVFEKPAVRAEEMECPKCGSEDFAALSESYDEGYGWGV